MVEASPQVGALYVIGGAEDKLKKRSVLTTFVEACGGRAARIAIVPTASSLGHEIVDVYAALFTRLGAAEVFDARPESREEAAKPELVERLSYATGIFMTGGNQLKLSAVVNGTPFGDAIREAHRRGVTIGGTSAGASFQSSHMVAFGSGGAVPKQRMTQLAAGLGLVEGCVIDQHFAQRNRYGRLLMVVAQSPNLLGIGVDEDTAAIITSGHLLDVIGRGAVTILDGLDVVSNAHQATRTRPLMVSGVRMHVLPEGARFDLVTRSLVCASGPIAADQAEEIRVAEDDLRQMVSEIAAEGISPTYLRRRHARRTSSIERSAHEGSATERSTHTRTGDSDSEDGNDE
jgi:cyanophycinase